MTIDYAQEKPHEQAEEIMKAKYEGLRTNPTQNNQSHAILADRCTSVCRQDYFW